MPHDNCDVSAYHGQCHNILSQADIISYVKAAVKLGIVHFRLTGGEPLLYPKIDKLVYAMKNEPGVETVSITTNGVLLDRYAQSFSKSKIDSINISLDAIDDETYTKITGVDCLKRVKTNIESLIKYGFNIKINAVLMPETDVLGLVEYAQQYRIPIRFIEMMPIGVGRINDMAPYEAVIKPLEKKYGMAVLSNNGWQMNSTISGHGPAVYYKFPGLDTQVGLIQAIHGKFCDQCNRIRITADGRLMPCLNSKNLIDLNLAKQNGDDGIFDAIKKGIEDKPQCHHFELENTMRTMDRIGG